MWTVLRLEEADFGCEERLPGEPLMTLVVLENDEGSLCQFEMPEDWLQLQEIEEGDEWPEDLDDTTDDQIAANQSAWLENYYEAMREVDELYESD